MLFVPRLFARPDDAPHPIPTILKFRILAAVTAVTICGLAPPRIVKATTLTLDHLKISHASGASLPAGFPGAISASTSPSGEAVTMTGGIGPVTRLAWSNAGISNLRMQFDGRVIDGVLAGDDVSFGFAFLVWATRGTVSWTVRGNASVPPAQGFIEGPSGTVVVTPEEFQLVTGVFGRTFLFNSTGDGTYAMFVDFSWNGANSQDMLEIQLLSASAHLPTPGAGTLALIAGLALAPRPRRERV